MKGLMSWWFCEGEEVDLSSWPKFLAVYPFLCINNMAYSAAFYCVVASHWLRDTSAWRFQSQAARCLENVTFAKRAQLMDLYLRDFSDKGELHMLRTQGMLGLHFLLIYDEKKTKFFRLNSCGCCYLMGCAEVDPAEAKKGLEELDRQRWRRQIWPHVDPRYAGLL
jgi:hypothetical protein